MQENLVIVESPAKAKTIEKFLGKDYIVKSSFGHIRDLSKKDLGINIDDEFRPVYEIPGDKKKVVDELTKLAKSKTVWLASDEDREGEAIAWHLTEVLGLPVDQTKRIVFHEITKRAILEAIEKPRTVNMDLVNAQQARRILDRLVGFELSPVLWKKVRPALSAGRVQSVAVRLIVEREREIIAFRSAAYFRVVAQFYAAGDPEKTLFKAELSSRFETEAQAETFLQSCIGATFTVAKAEEKPAQRYPAPPFTTSTLQQEAGRKLGMSVSQTMSVAQHLYEQGLITYMRTDSVNLSELALSSSRDAILSLMGERYVHTRQYATKTKGAQEAHEAIRPTYMSNESIEGSSQEVRLYELIWKRTLASQMADAELEKTTATISVSGCEDEFQAVGEVVTFDGFLKVYKESFDEEVEQEDAAGLPKMEVGEVLQREEIAAVQRFSQAPARYTEASLVRKLEELGIGRPSTYAPTISTIQQRGYVEKGNKEGVKREYSLLKLTGKEIKETVQTEMSGSEKSKLIPTDVGCVVNDFLMQYFPKIMDYNFTASVEKEFDEVAEGEKKWTDLMEVFYENFHPLVETTLATKTEHKVGERMLGTDPKSGKPVSVKIGRFGPVVQIGSSDDEEKPRFAQLNKEHSLETITLEEALDLFKLPRVLGELDGTTVSVGVGRFGPYVRHGNEYVSIPKEMDPMAVTFEEAVRMLSEKKEKEAQKIIKQFPENPDMQILNGRYGPYIAYQKKNYKIPENVNPADLNLDACFKVIELQAQKAEMRKAKGAKAKTKK